MLGLVCGVASACRCVEPGPAGAYRGSLSVVKANVLAVTGDAEGPGGALVRLSVAQSWKTEVPATLEVRTSTTCAYVFEPGREYLVYLRRDLAGSPLSTRRCMGNRPLAEAQGSLQWLQRHGKPAAASAPR